MAGVDSLEQLQITPTDQTPDNRVVKAPGSVIAVLGGSFNPITNAHLNVAAEILHSKQANEVWVVPCGNRPDKPSLTTPSLQRLIMCHLAVNTTFGSRFKVKVSDVEMHRERAFGTWSLMRHFRTQHPDHTFKFVIGEDLISGLAQWDDPECPTPTEAGSLLLRDELFLVISRPGHANESLPPNFERIRPFHPNSSLVEIMLSSTEVRTRIKSEKSRVLAAVQSGNTEWDAKFREKVLSECPWYNDIECLVPPAVLAHIIRYRLYAD